jgi:hypothetical protein
MRALRLSRVVYEDGGIRNIGAIFYGLLLALPYVFVWGIFLAFTLEGIFKLLAITAVSPLLIAVAGFGPTRGFALTGLRVIVGGVLTVVFAGVAMGFTMTVLRQALDGAPLATGGIKPDISGFLGSEQYWLVLLIGFISILFHLKAATLAANISGASDGPGAAATVVGAGMAAVGAAKTLTLKSAQKLGRKGSEAFGAGARAARDRIMGGGKAPAATQGGD